MIPRAGFAWPELLPFLVIGLIWWPALSRASIQWSLSPQYYYGWAVPLLAAYLLYERFGARVVGTPIRSSGLVIGVVAFVAVFQLPLRLLGEANSTSGLISWVMAMIAVVVSAGVLLLAGGRCWLRQFLPPVLFLLVAIPWPGQVEGTVIQGLMRVNAQIATEFLNALGVAAVARGNLIEIPTGLLGVNEACSGIRSLQSTLMAALFMALLYGLSRRGGLLLVLVGVAIALVCNVARTVFLAWTGAFHGIESTEQWHDSAGFVILGVVLACLWVISAFLDRSTRRKATSLPAEQSAT